MAVSSSLCKPLSFLSPPTPNPIPTKSPAPPSQLTLPLSSSSLSPTITLSHTLKPTDELFPAIPKHYPQSSLSSDLMSVMCPSVAFSNTLFFKSAYNVQVIVGDNEPEEKLIGRFRRDVLRAGVIQESKRRRFFETTQEKKKRKAREAAKRNRKRRPQAKTLKEDNQEASKEKDKDEEDDNWEFFDVELPYCGH